MLSSRAKWLIAISLLLTIPWKLTIKPENPAELEDVILNFLDNHQFKASVTDKSLEYMRIIDASSRTCHLLVAKISPLGYEADVVRLMGDANDRVFYVFRGMAYKEQPVNLTVASYLWFRFLRELGLISRIPAVLAVISSCDAEKQPPWNELPA